MTIVAALAMAAGMGAAGAAGGWAWSQITHIHHHLFLLEDRVAKLGEAVTDPPMGFPPLPQPPGAAPVTPPPLPPKPVAPPLIPAVKPVTLTVDARQVIEATVGQMETKMASVGSELMTAAIQEALQLLDPLIQKYVDQLEQKLPGLLAQALKHLWVEDPDMKAAMEGTGQHDD